jgi:hypothetical protein
LYFSWSALSFSRHIPHASIQNAQRRFSKAGDDYECLDTALAYRGLSALRLQIWMKQAVKFAKREMMIKMGRAFYTHIFYVSIQFLILAREIFYDMRGAAAKSLALCENLMRA